MKLVTEVNLQYILQLLKEWLDERTPFKRTKLGGAVLDGSGLEAKNANEVALGQYNSSTYSNDLDSTIFSVGIGENDEMRKNGLEIKKSGDIYIQHNGESSKLQDIINNPCDIDEITDEDINNLKVKL